MTFLQPPFKYCVCVCVNICIDVCMYAFPPFPFNQQKNVPALYSELSATFPKHVSVGCLLLADRLLGSDRLKKVLTLSMD